MALFFLLSNCISAGVAVASCILSCLSVSVVLVFVLVGQVLDIVWDSLYHFTSSCLSFGFDLASTLKLGRSWVFSSSLSFLKSLPSIAIWCFAVRIPHSLAMNFAVSI